MKTLKSFFLVLAITSSLEAMDLSKKIPFALVLEPQQSHQPAKIYYKVDTYKFLALKNLKTHLNNLPDNCSVPEEIQKGLDEVEYHKVELNRLIQALENHHNKSCPVNQYRVTLLEEKMTSFENIFCLSLVASFKELSPTFILDPSSLVSTTFTDYNAIKSLLNKCEYITETFTPQEFAQQLFQKTQEENQKKIKKLHKSYLKLKKIFKDSMKKE